jgi:hypothetical protein
MSSWRWTGSIGKQMKRILLMTIAGSALAALAAIGAPQPLASPTFPADVECGCRNLKTLQIELRNALHLQQAFRNKIPELREKGKDSSQSAFEAFAKGEARLGLESIPDYKGPLAVEYYPWGRWHGEDPDLSKKTAAVLCQMLESSAKDLREAKEASACAGIAAALQAHEDWHIKFCTTIGFRPYEEMHGADRAQEEVEAYDKQIAVLRAEIAKVLKKNCVAYRASGNAGGDTVFSGDICDLEKPFTLKTNNPFLSSFEFVPSSSSGGKWSFSTTNGVIGGGSGTYTITGTDTERTGIEMTGWSTGTVRGATRSGGGTVHIDLTPLDQECKP